MTDTTCFDQILGVAPFACILIKDDYIIKYINPVMAEYLCFSNDNDMLGLPILQFIPKSEHHSFLEFIDHLDKSNQDQSWQVFRLVDSGGNEKEMLINGTNQLSELGSTDVKFLVGIPVSNEIFEEIKPNIFDQKLLEKYSYNKYQTLFDNATIGILILNHDGTIDESNQIFADFLGFSKGEMTNRHFEDLFKETTQEDFDKLRRMINAAKNREVKNIITIDPTNVEHKILEISLTRIDNHYGNKGLIMMIAEDITNEQDTYTALLQSEKLALTGRLAASLAHEINNPLQTSIGCLGLADEMLDGDDNDLRVYIKMAMDELQRSARIVKKLRDLNRSIDAEDKESIDLQGLLDDVLALTKNRLVDRNIETVYLYQGSQSIVQASKDQLQQVFLNLIMNAIDALPKGGKIFLDIQQTDIPLGVSVSIRDTGVGMTQEVMENIFDPFFTTKEDGLGLGLYNSKKIIDDHNGKLSVDSTPGKGTKFSIWLPGFNVERQDQE